MLLCPKCKVNVRGDSHLCPLCQGPLTGTPNAGENVFPQIPIEPQPYKFIIKLIAFFTIVGCVVCAAVNLSIPGNGWWSIYVIAGTVIFWLAFFLLEKKRTNIPKAIIWQLVFGSLVIFLWDFFTGFHRWSLNYVMPIAFSSAMLAMAVFARVRKLAVQDYVIYLVVTSVFSILSLLLIIFNLVSVVYPSVICFGLSIISLASLVIFEGKALWSELQRRTHI